MENPQTTLTLVLLAKEFHRIVRKELVPSELQFVDKVNEAVLDASTCATHDYTDANMLMSEAFTNVVNRDVNYESDDDVLLWNMAWGLAQCNGFTKDWDDRPRPG